MFRFLHTADIHLDSPLRGLESYEDAPIEEIRSATRRALDNLIELAIEERVDFILIVGDLFDGDWKDMNTGLFFAGRMKRLMQANISVYIVSGNHDFDSPITKTMPLPDSVTLFSSANARSLALEKLGVVIHGQSYPSRAVTDNLATDYPPYQKNYFNIGLLHTALNGRTGHEPYAPCSLDDLRAKGYDYWALGHIHQSEIVSEDPWVVFPGNIQGRHIRECGKKGAVLVTVESGRVTALQHKTLDVLRWSLCRVNLIECDSIESVHEAVRRSVDHLQQKAEGRTLAIRLILEGRCPIHTELLNRQVQLSEAFRVLLTGHGNIWIEKVQFNTSRMRPLEEIAGEDTPLGGLIQSMKHLSLDEETIFQQIPSLARLKQHLPPELLDEDIVGLSGSRDHLNMLKKEVRELLITKFFQHGDQREIE